MLQMSTLLLQLSVENLWYRFKLSWIEDKSVSFDEKKQFLGYII